MSNHKNLASLKVRDIDHLLVVEPSWVYESASIDEVMQKMLADLRTRWIYVIDAQKKLLGGVPMNAVVEFLFPLEALVEHPEPLYEGYFPKAGAKTARDLMLSPIPSVTATGPPSMLHSRRPGWTGTGPWSSTVSCLR